MTQPGQTLVLGCYNYQKGTNKIREHSESSIHIRAFAELKMFLYRINQGQTIDAHQNAAGREILHNREILLDVTLYLARQNLGFRGHREDKNAKIAGIFLSY